MQSRGLPTQKCGGAILIYKLKRDLQYLLLLDSRPVADVGFNFWEWQPHYSLQYHVRVFFTHALHINLD